MRASLPNPAITPERSQNLRRLGIFLNQGTWRF